MDIEMVDTMRLIEQQNWMSEMNNDIRRDAVRKYKTIDNQKCQQDPSQNNFNKITTKQ